MRAAGGRERPRRWRRREERRRRLISNDIYMSLAFAVTTLHTARRTVGAGGGGRRRGPPAEERGACCLGGEGQAAFAWPCVYVSPPMQLNNYLTFFIVFYYLLECTTWRNGRIYRSCSTGEFSLLVGHSWWFMDFNDN